MDIRKISVGPDYKSGAMHYVVGQPVLDKTYKIHTIKINKETQFMEVWIEDEDSNVLCWKEFNPAMPISIENNIFTEFRDQFHSEQLQGNTI